MKLKRLFAALLSLLLLSGFMSHAADNKKCLPVSIDKENLAFKGGEKLVFTIHYKWGPINADVAQATLKVDSTVLNGKSCYHGSLKGKTQKIYEQVFKLKEDFDCWFTCKDLKPVKFSRDCREGNYWCTNLYTYRSDHIDAQINNSRRGEFSVSLPLDDCTYDIATMLFLLRNMDASKLKAGGRYPMTYACDHHIRNIYFVYYGIENRKVSGKGVVRCHKFGFEMPKGETFDGESDLFAWLTADDNRIPVYFVAPLKIGQVQGRLNSSSGLRHAFSSVVK
ncbi:MAG: DUF3108 domain-containing protein [Bacteroidales bacterium]|nr:DUF3108 domain-containing protein [Bacteroidales bacterium]